MRSISGSSLADWLRIRENEGVLAATLVGFVTLVIQLLTRTISAQFDGVAARFEAIDAKFEAKFEAVDRRFEALHAEMVLRFEHQERAFDERFSRLETKLEGLDRDVQAISRRVFPE
jgi:hypothetical protein